MYLFYFICLSGALVDIFQDYKYMYIACGVMMLVAGIFLFIMNYYNYKKLDEEERERRSAAVEMRSEKLSVMEEGEALKLKMSQDDQTATEKDG